MRILLSIKPQYAEKILRGEKIYEYRKTLFKRTDITVIVIYSSSPVCRIVGEFEIEDVITDSPQSLWKRTHKGGGIEKEKFDAYFYKREVGYAIKIKRYKRYRNSYLLKDLYPEIVPPQSYRYVE